MWLMQDRRVGFFVVLRTIVCLVLAAIAVLWMSFVREVRYCWDEAEALPGVAPDEPPDLSTCLLQQKLQLVNTCLRSVRWCASLVTTDA